jgi:NADH-quinone oxidoreductase subunit F
MTSIPNDELLARLAASGLRGRGGGWFPTARKWHAVRVEGGDPVLVANGAEGEPGSVKDRFLMIHRADDVVAGLALAAHVIGAREAVIFLKASFDAPARALEDALRRSPIAGVAVSLRRGDDSYITGEETAVLETIEGRRPWPRPKPPLPAAVGLFGRPTLVQNVETLARAPYALADPALFRASERTYVSLWGHVARPGVYEVPLGTPLRAIVEHEGGGAPDGIGMLFPAGPSAAPLSEAEAELPLDPDALRAAGSGLGTAALLVVGKSACPLSVASSLSGFFQRESCGQCPPCSVGSTSLSRILDAVEEGRARPSELRDLAETAGFMSEHGYCAHSRTAAGSVTGLFARFRRDVEAHLAARACPRAGQAGVVARPFDPASPERAAIEATLPTWP